MKIINCTPHPVDIYSADGVTLIVSIPRSGHVVRVATPPQTLVESLVIARDLDSILIPVVTAQDFSGGRVTGLPTAPEDQGATLIVGVIGAGAVARAWNGPVYVTDTGPESVVRRAEDSPAGKKGDILGVRRLARPE